MLHEESEYFNKEVAGVKTGTTNKAGNCLVSVFSIQNERYLCIVMNSSYYGKFSDTQTLYEMCAEAS
jgi:D-alanyl-D-alanine carboxypeptidase